MARQATVASRIALGAALIALLPTVVLAASFLLVGQREIRKQVDAALLAEARGFARLVQSSILDPLARDNVMRAWVSEGRVAGAFSGPAGAEACRQFLAGATRGRVVIGGQLLDRSGKAVCSSAPELPSSAPSGAPWFRAALDGSLASEGVVAFRQTRALSLATVLAGPDGEARGVLRVWYEWKALAQLLDGILSASRREEEDMQLAVTSGAQLLYDTGGATDAPAIPAAAASGTGEQGNDVVAWERNDAAPTDPGGGFNYVARRPRAAAFAAQRRILRAVALVAILTALLAAAAAWFFSGRLMRPLVALEAGVERIVREGDLAQHVEAEGDDEIGRLGRSFAAMVEKLRQVPQSLREHSNALSSEVMRLDQAAREQNERIARQAAALQQAQVTAQEIRQTSLAAAAKAKHVLDAARRADEVGTAAQGALAATLAELEQILRRVEAISRTMDELDRSTSRIAEITLLVKDLADQSNMLALNAAIEAVRSGEHGRGFAVVAREIRSLADQSIAATERVQEHIEGIRAGAARAVKITGEGTRSIADNLTRVRESGESLRELGAITSDNTKSVREIALAVEQQNAGIEQVFTAVRELSGSMADLVRLIEQSTGSVREVGSVSARIGGIVGGFRF